jgi:hypothetical protein
VGPRWQDITTSVDTEDNVVHGQTPALSLFFLATADVTSTSDEQSIPKFEFLAFSPNPAESGSTIRYQLVEDGDVRIRLFSAHGRLVRTLVSERERRDASGRNVGPGIFFLQMQVNGKTTGSVKVVVAN